MSMPIMVGPLSIGVYSIILHVYVDVLCCELTAMGILLNSETLA